MNIHEYQAKKLLRKYGVTVPRGDVAYTSQVAEEVAWELGGPIWVIKAQIHAGGRGAGFFQDNPKGKGGVRVVSSVEDVVENAQQMLNQTLVTKQTGPQGKEVKRIYLEEGCDIRRELYLAMVIDRKTAMITLIASTEGGMEIEEVAAHTPEKILKVAIDPSIGMQSFHARKIAYSLNLKEPQDKTVIALIRSMYRAFIELDATLIEINPLVITGTNQVLALDAKMTFDDNALFRHKDLEEMRDESEMDPTEVIASKHDVSYVKLDGTIGCMVNGAGLAMATMDIIKYYGGAPANFLDVGGGASKERVITAFKLILSDPNVKAILINIFGGIMRCDVIAEGVIAAAREVNLHVPLVVRLEGTNVDIGKKILADSDLRITSADTLADAAQKAVKAVRKDI